MKIESKQTESFSSILFTAKLPILKRTFRFHLMLFKSPDTWVTGYTSRTKLGLHIIMMDYDHMAFDILTDELGFLQKKHKLSDFYIFQTKEDGWHVVCLDTHTLHETYSILKDSSADESFIHSAKYLPFREWTLRLSEKGEREAPKFFKVFSSKYYSHVRSSGHAGLLKKLGVPIRNENKGKWDKQKKIIAVTYNTANRVRKE